MKFFVVKRFLESLPDSNHRRNYLKLQVYTKNLQGGMITELLINNRRTSVSICKHLSYEQGTLWMLAGKKILLVDGDSGIRKSLSLFFQYRGYSLHAYENTSLALVAVTKSSYDIIIFDQFLPDMNSLNFFKIINKKCHKAIKILVTAYGYNTASEKILKRGVDYVLTKPFSGDELEKIMVWLVATKCVKNGLNTLGENEQ